MKQIRTPLTGTKITGAQIGYPDIFSTHTMHPADELAEIRKELQRLHLRENELKQLLCNETTAKALVGERNVATVTRHNKRIFDTYLLPQHIQADPKFYRVENRDQVTTSGKPKSMTSQSTMPDMFFINADNIHELVEENN